MTNVKNIQLTRRFASRLANAPRYARRSREITLKEDKIELKSLQRGLMDAQKEQVKVEAAQQRTLLEIDNREKKLKEGEKVRSREERSDEPGM